MIAIPRHFLPCAALALLLTLLNALKPLHMDDAAFYCCAAQIARDPLSPYGFEIVWGQQLLPANKLLAPPLVPYWWAAGIRLFGENPFLWKLWLLPIALLLVFALHALARRFARGLEMPLVCLTVLSPSLLPGLNLMTDVPVLALSLSALALLLRAIDRHAVGTALLAGLVAGLAMQTKYTALALPPLLFVCAGLNRRASLGLLAAAVAATAFASWEGFVAWRHGQSHFLAGLAQQGGSLLAKLGPLFRALLNHVGGLAPAVALLGLIALRQSGRLVFAVAMAMGLGFVLMVALPQEAATGMTASTFVCRLLGLLVLGTLALVCCRLLGRGCRLPSFGARPTEWFLCLWLALELAVYFGMTPFPAARRVMGLLVIAVFLTARLAARTCRRDGRQRLVWAVTASGMLLGLAYYTVDLSEAVAQRRAVQWAARRVRGDGAVGWYAGTWGLKFYAERAGLKPVLPNCSTLRRGDWLVLPEAPLPHQKIATEGAPLALADRIVVADGLPLRTVWCYYGSNVPLEHHRGPRVSLRLYRVTADFTPGEPGALVRGGELRLSPGANAPGSPALRPDLPRNAHAARDPLDLAR